MQFMSYMIQYYYHVLSSNRFNTPNFTDLLRIAESIMHKDELGNKNKIKKISDMHKSVDGTDISMAEMELIFFKNAQKGINAEIEVRNKVYTLGKLFNHVNNFIRDLTKMVSEVAYQYDVDIPFGKGDTKIQW